MTCDRVVVAIAFAIGAVAFWNGRRDDAEIRRLTASADSLDQAIADSAASYGRQRQAESLRRLALEGEVIRLRRAYAGATGRTDSLLDTLTVVDSGAVRELRAAIASERAQAQALIALQDSTIQWQAGRIAYWRDTALAGTQQALAVQQRLLREALAAKRPSRFWAGVAVGAAVVGVVAAVR